MGTLSFPISLMFTNSLPRDGPHPYGVAKLDSSLVSQQPYDISLSLHLPRSPSNLAQGNFMLTLSLLRSSYIPPSPAENQRARSQRVVPPYVKNGPSSSLSTADTILTSRRPAILTYTSRLVSLSERLFTLPLYILRLRRESEQLSIPMLESESFERGKSNVPEYVMLEFEAGQEVQVYDVRIHFKARFGGLRWMMYNHRITAFVLFTCAFWFAELLFTIIGWTAMHSIFNRGSGEDIKREQIKSEEDDEQKTKTAIKEEPDTDDPDLSDTPRTFPTYGRQAPLRYEPKIKDEDSEEYIMDETAIQPLAAEADDEDDEVGTARGHDSGIGTSFSEGGDRGLARRRSKGGRVGS